MRGTVQSGVKSAPNPAPIPGSHEPDAEPVLKTRGLTFAYRPGAPVLQDVTLAFAPGCVTAIIGPNGAGKSTLLRLLAGVATPTSGQAQHRGVDLARMDPRERARRIAYVAQRPEVGVAFTVREVVALGRFARHDANQPTGRAAIERAMALLDLGVHAEQPFATLSVGQQQRVSLARALAQLDESKADAEHLGFGPGAVLLADEPVAAMDPRHALGAMDLFTRTAAMGVTVVVVLHDLSLALRVAPRVALLACGGTLAVDGPTHDTLTPSNLFRLFGVRFAELIGPDGTRALVPSREPAMGGPVAT